jgi:2-amino-4-hydroxy-6-hydroxymethyldihydropteridine diphosphokinase
VSRALIALGSNNADRKEFLIQALARLSYSTKILEISDIYETYGQFENRDPYLNCCLEVDTDMTSSQLISFLQETEKQISKEDAFGETSTVLDCDLISFGDEIVRTPKLTLPHPEAHRRAFVMIPLAQIKPQWVHPILKKTAEDLAKEAFWPGWGTFFAHGKSLLDF